MSSFVFHMGGNCGGIEGVAQEGYGTNVLFHSLTQEWWSLTPSFQQ